MAKRSVRDLDVRNKRVLLRVDYNVPVSKDGAITDDKRILETLPTIRYLLEQHAIVIIVTHLGRPDGKVVESLRLDKVAQRLAALLGKPVAKLNSVVGPDVTKCVAEAKPGDIIMLENVRFLKEEKNDESDQLAKQLAALADVYVDDAFATAHRPDTSVAGVPQFLPSAAGFLLEKEINVLETVTLSAKKPFIAILGGAKVSDKIGLIKNLMSKTDSILIGGGMAFTFLKAMGYAIGFSLVEEDYLKVAEEIMQDAKTKGIRVLLPVDVERYHARSRRATPTRQSILRRFQAIRLGWISAPRPLRLLVQRSKELTPSFGMGQWESLRSQNSRREPRLLRGSLQPILPH